MPKTKITNQEIEYLLRFGREMTHRMESLNLQPTAVARRTDGRVSSTYISDIRRVALGQSDRYFRLGREKVAAIAVALNSQEEEALEVAGYSTHTSPSALLELPDDAREMLACYLSLSDGQREDILIALRAIQERHRAKTHLTVIEFENPLDIDGSDAPRPSPIPKPHAVLL